MIILPSIEKAAQLLRTETSKHGLQMGHGESLNLAARTRGFKNWAHVKSARPDAADEVAAAKTTTAASNHELVEALSWVYDTLQALSQSKPIRNLDEVLEHARLVLERHKQPDEKPSAAIAENLYPRLVDWAEFADVICDAPSHLRINGGSFREIDVIWTSKLARVNEDDFGEVVIEYSLGVDGPGGSKIHANSLQGAQELEPGVIVLKDGRTLEFFSIEEHEVKRLSIESMT